MLPFVPALRRQDGLLAVFLLVLGAVLAGVAGLLFLLLAAVLVVFAILHCQFLLLPC